MPFPQHSASPLLDLGNLSAESIPPSSYLSSLCSSCCCSARLPLGVCCLPLSPCPRASPRCARQQIGAEEKRQLEPQLGAKYPNRWSSLPGAGLSGAAPQGKEIPSLQLLVLFFWAAVGDQAAGGRSPKGPWGLSWPTLRGKQGTMALGVRFPLPPSFGEGCGKPGGSRCSKGSDFRPNFPLPLALPLRAVTLCRHLEQRVARIARPCGRLAASASCRAPDTDLYFG